MNDKKRFRPNIGDTAWYADGRGMDNLTSGTVVNIFEHHNDTVYVMVNFVPGIGEYDYEARSEDEISEAKKRPLNWLRGIYK